MKMRTMVAAVACAVGLFVPSVVAQHEGHEQGQAATPADKTDMGKMGGMMMGQNDTSKLVDQIMKSFAAMESERDEAALREKLTAHGVLLKELQAKVQAQAHMMEMMQRMKQ